MYSVPLEAAFFEPINAAFELAFPPNLLHNHSLS